MRRADRSRDQVGSGAAASGTSASFPAARHRSRSTASLAASSIRCRSAPWTTRAPSATRALHGQSGARTRTRAWRRPVSRVLSRAGGTAIGRGRSSIYATYPGAERATCCGRSRLALPYSVLLRLELAAFHSRSRRSGHRHCGAGPRLAADGRYPLACSVELGLSSDAAFRPMRPRPSGRLQGARFYQFERLFARDTAKPLTNERRLSVANLGVRRDGV